MYYNSISQEFFNSSDKNSSGKIFPQYYYRLDFSFNGTKYFGWQKQKCGNTVQETMEEVLRNIFHKKDLVLTGSGRTDTGVHALNMTASFHVDAKIPQEELKTCLEKRLPHDIAILSVRLLPYFNAHEEARGKAYVYTVKLHDYSLFLPDGCWAWVEKNGDLEGVKLALKEIAGEHDFRNFTGRPVPDCRRRIFRAEFYDFSPMICFYFSGSGFLHKMVRRLAGGLHEVYTGKITSGDFIRALHDPNFHKVQEVAPPKGLYLKKVFYHPDDWKKDLLQFPPFFY